MLSNETWPDIYLAYKISGSSFEKMAPAHHLRDRLRKSYVVIDPLEWDLKEEDAINIVKRNVSFICRSNIMVSVVTEGSIGMGGEFVYARMLRTPVIGYFPTRWQPAWSVAHSDVQTFTEEEVVAEVERILGR